VPTAAQARSEAAQQGAGFDLSHIGQIGQMIAAAQQSGSIQVQNIEPGQMQGVDFDGSGLRDEIMGIMREHGIDPESGATESFNAAEMPAMQQQIMNALSRRGLNFGQGWPGSVPGAPPEAETRLPSGWDPSKQVNPPAGSD